MLRSIIGEVHLIPERFKGIMAWEQLSRPPYPSCQRLRGLWEIDSSAGELDDPDA